MKIVCLIQAREGSTRFPGKVRADLNGLPVIDHVLKQAQRIGGISTTWVIWPKMYPNREEADVLGRYADAARDLEAEAIVRITGDCPLFDPQIGTRLVWHYKHFGEQYVSNVWPVRTWPDGMDCEVFDTELLYQADRGCHDPVQREHVTPWIRERARTWYNLTLPVDWSHVRLTVDYPEDLEWLKHALNAPRSSFNAPST